LKRRVEQSTLGLLFSRRSIRRFRKSAVSEDVVRLIVEAGQAAPCYLQAYSVVWLRDERLVDEVAKVCESESIRQSAAVFLICLDFNRVAVLANTVERDNFFRLDAYPPEVFLSLFEAGLVVENMIIATEALGYGSLILDCGLLECEALVELLKLPQGVIPLSLLLVGDKDESPPPRPRWPVEKVLHIDGYKPITPSDAMQYVENAEKTLLSEGYLLKYIGFSGTYREYLAERLRATNDVKQHYQRLSSFLKKMGAKV